MAKAAFSKWKAALFSSKVDLYLRKIISELPQLGYRFVRYWNLDTLDSRSEISGKF
jgi:hypothetical protein